MHKGTVILWNDQKGFGFIKREDGGADIFTHYTLIISDDERKSLQRDQRVSFDIEMGPKGKPQACNVTVIGG